MRNALVFCLLAAAGCSAPTAADKGRFAEASIIGGAAACLMLAADKSIPRSARSQEHCDQMLKGCAAE
jgi:hypothetical protein